MAPPPEVPHQRTAGSYSLRAALGSTLSGNLIPKSLIYWGGKLMARYSEPSAFPR